MSLKKGAPSVARAKRQRAGKTAAQSVAPAARTRQQHVVLVPGFVGFDALGQVNYYSGVTELFHRGPKLPSSGSLWLHYSILYAASASSARALADNGWSST